MTWTRLILPALTGAVVAGGLAYGLSVTALPGTDDKATGAIAETAPDYRPWVESPVDPGDAESWLFALQAALGGGMFVAGLMLARRRA